MKPFSFNSVSSILFGTGIYGKQPYGFIDKLFYGMPPILLPTMEVLFMVEFVTLLGYPELLGGCCPP